MATLILICGLPGSGKTTLARRLERERPALRLTPDEWIARLFGPAPASPVLDAARDPVEAVQWEVAARALVLGVDVILDFGFWSRSEREHFRSQAEALGAGSELHFLDATREDLAARLAARNAELPPGTFHVSEMQLHQWWSVFEPPTLDELQRREPLAAG
jgi:predicted kinase